MQVGLLTAAPSPLLSDLVIALGFDFVVLDAEQTGLTPRDCADAARRLSGRSVLVRVPDLDPTTLLAYANSGVDELVLPQVRSLGELDRAWGALQYPPNGSRPRQTVRASGYGTQWQRVARLSAIIETVDAFDAAEEVAACEHLAGTWVGTTDLADDMTRHGRLFDANENLAQLVERLSSGSRYVGLPARDQQGAVRAQQLGANRCAVYWEAFAAQALAALVASTRTENKVGSSKY